MKTDILKRIQKLLALAGSENEHEAKAAMDLANSLLLKHNISLQEAGESLAYSKQVLYRTSRSGTENKFICSILMKHFCVELVRSRRGNETTMFILGTDTNIEIARYVFAHLKTTFKSLFKNSGFTAKSRQSFYCGLWSGFDSHLAKTKEKVKQETGLVLVKDTDLSNFKDGQFGNLRKSTQRYTDNDGTARAAGLAQGKNIRINRAMTSSGSQGKLLA